MKYIRNKDYKDFREIMDSKCIALPDYIEQFYVECNNEMNMMKDLMLTKMNLIKFLKLLKVVEKYLKKLKKLIKVNLI